MERGLKVLVDACVLGHAITAEPSTRTETVDWGGQEMKVELPNVRTLPGPRGWLGEQVKTIPIIAEAARDGQVELFLATEVLTEVLAAPPDAVHRGPTHLFHGIQFKRCPDPLDYGRIVVSAFDTPEEATTRFADFVRSLPDEDIQKLNSALGGNKVVDAFHILTAARAGLDAMLTTDRRLMNSFNNARSISLNVEVLSPVELASRLAQ